MTNNGRVVSLLLVVAFVATACGAANDAEVTPAATTPATSGTAAPSAVDPSNVPPVPATLPEGPSALRDRFNESFPDPLIDLNDILSGGPPPDGIPPIDDPKFVTVAEADAWLNDAEPVLVVDLNGDVRAYPIQILIWHEIVNDTVGGVPLTVTYCPLCNSAVTFERTVRGVETTFGTSGSLYFANLVMYDRATESLWNQINGRAVVGVLTGETLRQVPSTMVAWSDFREARPDALVLDRDRTGASRSYGTNPYIGLDDPDGQPFLFRGDVDVRAKAMQRVVGLEVDDEAAAWTLEAISGDAETVVTTGEIAGIPVVVFWKAGQASALQEADVAAGRDVGTVGVFSPIFAGNALTFRAEGDGFVDDATGTTWNIFGEATAGELVGTSLASLIFVRTFWFSWSTFRPDTVLIEG